MNRNRSWRVEVLAPFVLLSGCPLTVIPSTPNIATCVEGPPNLNAGTGCGVHQMANGADQTIQPDKQTGQYPVVPWWTTGVEFEVPTLSAIQVNLNGSALQYVTNPTQQNILDNQCTPYYLGAIVNTDQATGPVYHWRIGLEPLCFAPTGSAATCVWGGGSPAMPNGYTVSIIDQGSGGTTAPPLNFTVVPTTGLLSVTVAGFGQGVVNSSPGGIYCGYGGTACSDDFGKQTVVSLRATPIAGSSFRAWSTTPCFGTCSFASPGVCTISTPARVAAIFDVGVAAPPPPPNCPTPVPQDGYTYWNVPGCATNDIVDHPAAILQCDSQGYFCCEPSHGANTKCGVDQRLFPPDCMEGGPQARLIQPYGCYMKN
jgi:hypothetical protein